MNALQNYINNLNLRCPISLILTDCYLSLTFLFSICFYVRFPQNYLKT